MEHPDYPVGSRRDVQLDGHRLSTWQAGDEGPVVLLVHGLPTNASLWWDVVPRLHQRARVVAPDLAGYGRSEAPDRVAVHLAAQASYLLDLLDALEVERAVVVGHDLGGGIAQILATAATSRVAGLAVVNGVCYDAWPVPLVRAMKASWPVLERLPAGAVQQLLRGSLRTLFAQRDRAGAFVERFVTPWGDRSGPHRLARHLRSLDSVFTQAVAPFLPRLELPAEVVWGRRDHQLKPAYAERLAADLPQAELTFLDDASHFSPADRPDAVADAVLRLLARV